MKILIGTLLTVSTLLPCAFAGPYDLSEVKKIRESVKESKRKVALGKFIQAMSKGDMNKVIELKEEGLIDEHFKGKTHQLFNEAIRHGDMEMVKYFYDPKNDINQKEKSYGQTALHIAVSGHSDRISSKEILNFLLKKGADPNAKDKYGNTPLHKVTATGTLEELKLLLANDAFPYEMDGYGRTPVDRIFDIDKIEYLLEINVIVPFIVELGREKEAKPANKSIAKASISYTLKDFHNFVCRSFLTRYINPDGVRGSELEERLRLFIETMYLSSSSADPVPASKEHLLGDFLAVAHDIDKRNEFCVGATGYARIASYVKKDMGHTDVTNGLRGNNTSAPKEESLKKSGNGSN